jgi:acetyltransferase-like isoleucine patch superfamily enzyme
MEMMEKRFLLKDSASLSNQSWSRRIRGFFKTLDSRISCGKKLVLMPNVDIRLCDNAKLIIGDHCSIDSYVYLQLTKPEPTVILGDYVSIGRGTVIAAKKLIQIGAYTQIGPFCQINDQSHDFKRDELIMNQKAIIKPVVIGKDCWFGSGVRIVMGVTIGDGVVVGAGSIVTKDIPAYQVWAGNPARFIKERT